jgi:hypothetical protein
LRTAATRRPSGWMTTSCCPMTSSTAHHHARSACLDEQGRLRLAAIERQASPAQAQHLAQDHERDLQLVDPHRSAPGDRPPGLWRAAARMRAPPTRAAAPPPRLQRARSRVAARVSGRSSVKRVPQVG